jgi:hypothetical protein
MIDNLLRLRAAFLFGVMFYAMYAADATAQIVRGKSATGDGVLLEGVWDFSTLTPLQRPEQFSDNPFLTVDQAAVLAGRLRDGDAPTGLNGPGTDPLWLERGSLASINGRVPASLIVEPPDGRMPALSSEGRRRTEERRALGLRADQPEDRSLSERCLRAVSGPPYLPSPDANIIRIVQARDHVAITNEKFHDTRIVSLDGRPHVAAGIRQWIGDSRGRWEAGVLVVDTTNFTHEIGLTGNFDGNLHLTERFVRTGPTNLLYEATIDDPTAFAVPWKVSLPMRRIDSPLYEFACHEGNYALPNILRGARVGERSPRDVYR